MSRKYGPKIVMSCRTLYIAICCLLLSGCLRHSTNHSIELKRQSLASAGNVKIDGSSLQTYIGRRIGILLRDIVIEDTVFSKDELETTLKENGGFGMACAVSSDGYYLTARHCVQQAENLYLITPQSENKLFKISIVWFSPDYDLALIKVPVHTVPFPISHHAEPGTACFCGGGVTSGSCSAGTIRTISRESDFSEIIHSAPLMKGESGGPLITPDGFLVGVNVRADTRMSILWPLRITKGGKALMISEQKIYEILDQYRMSQIR